MEEIGSDELFEVIKSERGWVMDGEEVERILMECLGEGGEGA